MTLNEVVQRSSDVELWRFVTLLNLQVSREVLNEPYRDGLNLFVCILHALSSITSNLTRNNQNIHLAFQDDLTIERF